MPSVPEVFGWPLITVKLLWLNSWMRLLLDGAPDVSMVMKTASLLAVWR
jgi:hypothetical protein